MARVSALNPEAIEPEAGPEALSEEILAEARALEGPDGCHALDRLTGQLHGTDPARIGDGAARIAFWVNLYNALVLHRMCLKPLQGSLLRHLRSFDAIAYRVGGRDYPLNVIEHGLLRGNRRPPYRPRRLLGRSDPRLASAPSRLDPRVHFALNCGARSCPPIRAYEPQVLDAQLDLATRGYLEAEASVEVGECRVALPRLMRLYKADFGDRREQLAFAARYLPGVADCLEAEGANLKPRYSRFDWTVAQPRST